MKIVTIVVSAYLLGGAAGAVTASLSGAMGQSAAYCAAPVAEVPLADTQAGEEDPWQRFGASQGGYELRFARSMGVTVAGI